LTKITGSTPFDEEISNQDSGNSQSFIKRIVLVAAFDAPKPSLVPINWPPRDTLFLMRAHGLIPFAMKQLSKAVTPHKPLGLTVGPTTIAQIQNIDRFLTTHSRTNATAVELRHALLPFPNA
jgi:hypothetical protein